MHNRTSKSSPGRMCQLNNNRVRDINKQHSILAIIFQVNLGHKVTKEICGDWSKQVRKVLRTRKECAQQL